MTTYERVEELRSKEGISQGKLEKKIGLSNGQISKWKKNNPSAESLYKIAKYFDVSIEYLISNDVIGKENIWKQGKYTPKINKLKLISDYFDVEIDYFIQKNNADVLPELSNEELKLLSQFRKTDDIKKKMIWIILSS